MKHLFPLAILCFLFSGCSTTTTNTQNYTQICPQNNSNESQIKQCCLKESFDANIKYKDLCVFNSNKDVITSYVYLIDSTSNSTTDTISTCSCTNKTNDTYQKDDSTQKTASSNFTINPSLSLDFSKKNEINTNIDYQNKNSNAVASQTPHPNANINVNNIRIENTNVDKTISITTQIYNYWNKNYLTLILVYIIIAYTSFTKIKKKFIDQIKNNNKNNDDEEKTSYNILAPIDNADLSDETRKQLRFSILEDKEKIKNIALTGPYGSGKSSIWKTFCRTEKIYTKKKIVEISLAKFEDSYSKNTITTYNEQEIEKAIILQLLYSREKNELKYSSFPKIYNLTDKKTTIITIICFIFFFLILPITNDNILSIINSWSSNPFQYLHITLLFLFFSLTLYFLLFFLIQKINKFRISKICLKDVEIKIGNNESYFNKYLDEIFYFFEATKCNCVVIEDLDRFNSSKIFTKLREINTLINNNPTIKAAVKDTIKFIYIVKDNIFSKYERTKFFDFIIPIVPIFNGDNATSYIKEHFLKGTSSDNKKPNLSLSYLEDIQIFLDDLRLIINCFNEFKIYKEVNKHIDGNDGDEKIFSLILYKNLYPKDFQELLRQKGVLHYCLNKSSKDLVDEIKKKSGENKGGEND